MRKTISFTGEYEKEFDHLCSKDNPSLYVRELIRKDRLGKGDNLETRIEKLISQLETGNFTIYSSEIKNQSQLKKKALKNMMNFN